MCEHEDFHANVSVNRLQKTEGGPVAAFSADITIKCAKCGKPFRFLGLECGSSPVAPMVSVDATELRAPIAPVDEETATDLPGFKMHLRGSH